MHSFIKPIHKRISHDISHLLTSQISVACTICKWTLILLQSSINHHFCHGLFHNHCSLRKFKNFVSNKGRVVSWKKHLSQTAVLLAKSEESSCTYFLQASGYTVESECNFNIQPISLLPTYLPPSCKARTNHHLPGDQNR